MSKIYSYSQQELIEICDDIIQFNNEELDRIETEKYIDEVIKYMETNSYKRKFFIKKKIKKVFILLNTEENKEIMKKYLKKGCKIVLKFGIIIIIALLPIGL